ncbi:MAG: hypothetical protein WCK48_03825 [bacterium]
MKKKYLLISTLGFLLPLVTFSADWSLEDSSFGDVIGYVLNLLGLVIPILFIGAFIFFFWGLSKFILSGAGDQAGRKKGQDYMMWGILALFILVTFRVFVAMISGEFEFKNIQNIKQVLPESGGTSMNITQSRYN